MRAGHVSFVPPPHFRLRVLPRIRRQLAAEPQLLQQPGQQLQHRGRPADGDQGAPVMPDFEVLHTGRTPDGDPLAHYRDQLQRLISAASHDGVILFVGPDQTAQAVRRPEAAA